MFVFKSSCGVHPLTLLRVHCFLCYVFIRNVLETLSECKIVVCKQERCLIIVQYFSNLSHF